MFHNATLHQIAKDRHQQLLSEAQQNRWVRWWSVARSPKQDRVG